ncbi:MAG: hypothetical protein ICCCNLDF_03578 [Planctomycetes bacterium]|nr:hypothetical protein [Planctomycetota bacterium]
MRRIFSGLLLGSVAVVAGCGHTKLAERHVLQVKDDDGQINYLRVTIEGEAKLAKTHYRAGLYDAQAVDALMGGPGDEGTKDLHTTLQRLRIGALNEVAGEYFNELQKDTPDLGRLNQLASRVYHLANTPADMIGTEHWTDNGVSFAGAPPRKYVVMFTALASVVEEAIANFVEERKTQEAVMNAIAGPKREEYLRAKARLDQLQRSRKTLAAAFASLAAEGADRPESLRSTLLTLASMDDE